MILYAQVYKVSRKSVFYIKDFENALLKGGVNFKLYDYHLKIIYTLDLFLIIVFFIDASLSIGSL